MVRDHPHRNIGLFPFSVLHARNPAHMLPEGEKGVDVKHGVHSLHHAGKTL